MGELRIDLLGNAAITYNGAPVAVARKPYGLLCLLISTRAQAVGESWLTHHLWQGSPPTTAGTALRVYLSKLRSILEPDRDGAPSSRIARTVVGWRLRLGPAELDLLAFETAAAEANAAWQAGDHERAWTLSRAALASWRGDPFPGVDLEPVAMEGARLLGIRRRLIQLTRAAAVRTGHGAEVLDELQRAHREDSDDELIVAQLAQAVYQTGGQQPALALLRRHRRRLRAAGLDASPELAELEQLVLRHEAPARAPTKETEPARSDRGAPLGREDLHRTLVNECARRRCVLLIGEAGVGKSVVLDHLVLPGYRTIRVTCPSAGGPLSTVRAILAVGGAGARDASGWDRLRRALLDHASARPTPTSIILLAEDLLCELLRAERLLICIDDADQLDAISGKVLTTGLQSGDAPRIVLAGRGRGALGSFAGIGDRPAEIQPSPDTCLVVPPLGSAASARLLARLRTMGGHDRLDDETALRVAGGNPWLLEWSTASRSSDAQPSGLLAGLSANGRAAVLILALLRTPLALDDVEQLLVRSGVEELLVTGIAVLADHRCRIRHELIAEAVLREFDPQERRDAAVQVFRYATARGWPALDLVPIVQQAAAALGTQERRAWTDAAGWQCLQAGDPESGLTFFERIDDLAVDQQLENGRSWLGRARCLDALGDLAGARGWYVRAIHELQASGLDANVRDALLAYIGMFAPEAVEAPLVDAVTQWLVRRQILSDVELLPVLDAAAAAAEIGIDIERANATLIEAAQQVLTPLGTLYRVQGRWRQQHHRGASHFARLDTTASCVEFSEQVGDELLLVRSLRNRADSLLGAGSPEGSADTLARLDEVAHRTRIPQARWWVDVMKASSAIRRDELELAAALSIEACQRWTHLPVGQRGEIHQLQTLVIGFQSSRFDDLAAQLSADPGARLEPTRSLIPAAIVAVDAERGTPDAAAGVVEMITNVRSAGTTWLLPTIAYLLGRASVKTGQFDPWLETTLAEHAGNWCLVGTGAATLGPVDAVRAGLARLRGDHVLARRLAGDALSLCAKMGTAFWAADTVTLSADTRPGAGEDES